MMNKALVERFFQEYPIPTQTEDLEFPYANPSDAARALVRAYNWSGTITESLIELSEVSKKLEKMVNSLDARIGKIEREIVAANPPPSWAIKNKELQKAYILSVATEEEQKLLKEVEEKRDVLSENLLVAKRDYELYAMMLKNIERSSEWLIQYINWMKTELRMSNG